MENSLGTGLMAVFAVSGSVVLLALHAHKRLLSDFMNKIECEIGPMKNHSRKKVKFADHGLVEERSSSDGKANDGKEILPKACHDRVDDEKLDSLPLNWQALYKGIIEDKAFRGHA